GGAGGGSHLTSGVGAPTFRGYVGAGWSSNAPEGAEEPEVQFTFEVVDAHGPVAGAEVVIDGVTVGQTGDQGLYVHAGDIRWARGVEVRDAGHEPATVTAPADRAATEVTVRLTYRPVPIAASVTGIDGSAVPVKLIARSLDDPGRAPIEGAVGQALELPPGRYAIDLVADGMATQTRELVVPTTGDPPAPLDAVAVQDLGDGALAIRITDPEGSPIVGARVLVDGVPVGSTADGGLIAIAGFAEGPHDVEVQHPAFTSTGSMKLNLTADPTESPMTLQRVPGSVRVRVHGPDGEPVTDAVVRFLGKERLPPMALGPEGERTQVLSPGEWVAMVSSPRYGVQERDVAVPEGRFELITVDVVLRPSEAGSAELDLRVVDPSGRPIEGATVSLGGEAVGTTSTGGTVRLQGLVPGGRSLTVSGTDLEDTTLDVMLTPGVQERLITAAWRAGTVDVTVRGPDGPVADALVRFTGPPRSVAPERSAVGPTGRLRTHLGPGAWTVVVSSPTLGVQERDLAIRDVPGALTTVEFVLSPVEGGVADLTIRVVGADGEPIDGASVALNDIPVGTTGNGGTVTLSALDIGTRRITVSSPLHLENTDSIRLFEGSQDYEVRLDWAKVVRVRVRHAGSPVTDASVRVLGDRMYPPSPVDARGEYTQRIDSGFWLVLVTSPTTGVAEQDLEIRQDQRGLTNVDIELVPPVADRTDLMVTVIDPLGQAIEQAKVWVDDATLDLTQQGGSVLVRGLMPGPVSVKVEALDFVTTEPIPLVLTPGVQRYTFRLEWVEVPVTVRTVGPTGAPIDAEVQWTGGPADLAPVRSGARGEAMVPLRPGSWRVYAHATVDGEDLDVVAPLELRAGDEPRPIELTLAPTGAAMAGGAVRIKQMVQFDFGRATLRPDSEPILAEVARVLQAQPLIVTLEVQGHTDNVGTVPVNQSLSQARAEAVRDALIARGVPAE
ncbi:MAG: carboxypeptidase regulatory-like domain-containing protein, partial [Myxococcota bacterium]